MADATETLQAPPEAEPAPGAEAPPAAEKAAKPAKEKKQKKDKKDAKKGKADLVEVDGPSVAGHPRAARSIERLKSWAALVGFAAGFYESLPTHTFASTMLRAIVAGIALYVGVWAGSVFFWRRMVMLEIKTREQELVTIARAAQERRAATEQAQGPAN